MRKSESPRDAPAWQARAVDPLETLLALMNIERTIDAHLRANGVFIDSQTRLFLSRIRDAAQSTAAKCRADRFQK